MPSLPPRTFRAVKRQICVPHQAHLRLRGRGRPSDADTGADDGDLAVDKVGAAQHIDQAARQRFGLPPVSKQHGEFIPAEAKAQLSHTD